MRKTRHNGGAGKTTRATSLGGSFKCKECGQLATFGAKCPLCKTRYHVTCLLSMNKGKNSVCSRCFEKTASLTHDKLDDHMVIPDCMSPDGPVPYHAFTRNYASAKKELQMDVLEVLFCLFVRLYFVCLRILHWIFT